MPELAEVSTTSSELANVPNTTLQLDEKAAMQTLRLLNKLEELDETQNVSSNVDFDDSVLEKYQAQAR